MTFFIFNNSNQLIVSVNWKTVICACTLILFCFLLLFESVSTTLNVFKCWSSSIFLCVRYTQNDNKKLNNIFGGDAVLILTFEISVDLVKGNGFTIIKCSTELSVNS